MPLNRQRKPNRLSHYDYSQNGYYFITICTKNREDFFGQIQHATMQLNHLGEIAQTCWLNIPNHFPNTQIDEFIIMTNHVHGIVIIQNPSSVGNRHACSLHSIF